MTSSITEIDDTYSKTVGYAYPGGMSQRAAAEIQRMKEEYTRNLYDTCANDTLQKFLCAPNKTSKSTSQPKSKLILLLCN